MRPSKRLDGQTDYPLPILDTGGIPYLRLRRSPLRFLLSAVLPRSHDQRGTGLSQAADDGPADAASSAGDDDDTPAEAKSRSSKEGCGSGIENEGMSGIWGLLNVCQRISKVC